MVKGRVDFKFFSSTIREIESNRLINVFIGSALEATNGEFHDQKAKQALVNHSVKTMSAWNRELIKSRLSQIQDAVQRGAYPRNGGSKTEANSSMMGLQKH